MSKGRAWGLFLRFFAVLPAMPINILFAAHLHFNTSRAGALGLDKGWGSQGLSKIKLPFGISRLPYSPRRRNKYLRRKKHPKGFLWMKEYRQRHNYILWYFRRNGIERENIALDDAAGCGWLELPGGAEIHEAEALHCITVKNNTIGLEGVSFYRRWRSSF